MKCSVHAADVMFSRFQRRPIGSKVQDAREAFIKMDKLNGVFLKVLVAEDDTGG